MSLLQYLFVSLSRIIFSIKNRLARSEKYDRREPVENVVVIP